MASASSSHSEHESRLVDQAQNGDRGALGELLRMHHGRVYHVCLRMVSDYDHAADLTQEALLKAVQRMESFRGASRFNTWLMRIAINLCISHLRKGKLRRHSSLEAPPNGAMGADQAAPLKHLVASTREPSPESGVEKQEQQLRLANALDAMDPDLRGVIVLRDIEGMTYQQIADVLSAPVGTVKSRLFRARLTLRRQLEAENREESGE